MTKTKMRSVTVSEISVLKPSSHSEDESKEKDPLHLKPPSHPRSKLRTTLDTILTASFDCFLALLAVVFFVFGAFASHSNDQLVDEVPYADALLSAVQLVSALKCRTFITIAPVLTFGQGPTFFPMVFALIAVRLIKAIHRKVASGNKKRDAAQVRVLQQLLDSRTIGDTLVTLAKLRTINLSGILLVLLWAFSPLGGQASLRIASVETFPWPSNATFSYIDFDTIYSMYTGSSWWIANIDIVKAIYSTSLISSNTVRQSPQDAWKNLKVPAIELLNPPKNTSMWVPIPPTDEVVGDLYDNIYSSLVGIPIASNDTAYNDPVTGTTKASNATYRLETQYMYLHCQNISVNNVPAAIDLRQGWSVVSSANGFQIGSDTGERSNFNGDPTAPRQIYFQALGASQNRPDGEPDLISTTCNLTSSYVELNVSCIESSCSATHIRPSQQKHDSNFWSPLDYNSSVADSFFGDFVNATVPRQLESPSATEWYLSNPDKPFGIDLEGVYANYTNVNASSFSLRLTQLLNAYYLSNIAPAAIAGDLITKDWTTDYPYHYTSISGQITSPFSIIVCHNQWLVVLLVASVVMMVCGFACAVLGVLYPTTDDLDIGATMNTKRSKDFRKKAADFLTDD